MKVFQGRLAVLCIALSCAICVSAQDITKGSIAGVVRDQSGGVVAGATVKLASPFGDHQTKTGGQGEYSFSNLTPGAGYSVSVEHTGFSAAKVSNVSVGLNSRTTVDVNLQVGQTTQTVDVTTEGAAIDLNSAGTGAVLNESLYKNVPAGRNISAVINFSPGVADSAGAGVANPSINGASGLENQYIINGADVTDAGFGGFGTYSRVFGSLGNGVNFDFIQEVQVKTGGFEAQYGTALGGVINVVTKSGSNAYHGSIYGYFQPQQFEATRPNANPLLVTKGTYLANVGNIDFGGDFGGYLKKDKIFFYGGFNPTYGTAYQRADPKFANFQLGVVGVRTTTLNYTGKINWNLSPKHSIEGTVFGDPATTPTTYNRGLNTVLAGSPVDNLTTSSLDYGSRTWSGRYTGALTSKWIVTAGYSDHYNKLSETPFANGYRITDNTPVQEKTGGAFSYGGLGFQETFESFGHQFNVVSSHIFNFFGGHSIDYGYQFDDQPYDNVNKYTGVPFQIPNLPEFQSAAGKTQYGANLIRTHTNSKDPTSPIVLSVNRGNYSNPTVSVGQRYQAGFIQDSWNLGRHLTIKPGLRLEQQRLFGTSLAYVFSHNWAPRIGVIYDPTGKRTSKFFANWGRFYEKIPTDISIRAFSFETSVIGARYKDPGPGKQPDLSAANYVGGGRLSFQGSPDDLEFVAGGTGAQYQDEVVAGFEKEFKNGYTFSGRFVYRHIRRIVEDISGVNSTQANAGVPQQYVIANPSKKLDIFHNFVPCTSGPNCDPDTGFNDLNQPILGSDGIPDGFPNASRIYKAMELVVSRRFHNGLQLYANYTLSKLHGNFQGSFRSDNGQTDPNISSLFDFTNSDGLLGDQNRPGVLPSDRTHSVKIFGNYQWKNVNFGASWSILTGTPISKFLDHPVYLNAGEVPVGGRGALGRTDTTFPLNLHADYTWKWGEGKRVQFLADLFNIGNQTRIFRVNQNAELSNSPGVANPDFLQPVINGYQAPFNARLGIRFSF